MGGITVILLLALIFLGPKKLPELASGLGKFIREIRKTTADVKNEIQLDDAIRKPFEELRDAVTLHPEELKRRDLIKQQMEEVRRQAQELSDAVTGTDTPAESAPVTPGQGDATIVQESPLIPPPATAAAVPTPRPPQAPAARPTEKRAPISAPPMGTVAPGGQGAPATGNTPPYRKQPPRPRAT